MFSLALDLIKSENLINLILQYSDQRHKVRRDTLTVIFLIYEVPNQIVNIEFSGWP